MSLINAGTPFLSSQADSLGIPVRELSMCVRNGQLRRVLRGIYADPQVADTRELRCLALSLVCPAHAVIWGSTAAWVWGVDAYEPEKRSQLMPECVVPHHLSRQRRNGIRTVESRLAPDDIITVNGIRLTVPDRTAVDLLRFQRRPFARIDMGYEHVRVGVEFDGREFHTGEDDKSRDEDRRERLTKEFDWRLVTCDSASVMGPEPTLEEEVAQLLGIDSLKPRLW